eukprot:TRINITY_DN81_c0_g2_i2.p1 TRINITY_DN81_c0_g2~~TRINITY_DN81_c0_g2_i2.p1  ORF type:complete len:354 (+),score=76.55 TRINITY_DN81_c0_g2_i2:78-1064(+)
MSSELPIVCVTGAGGYLASQICLDLVNSGSYQVHGTVRNLKDEEAYSHLKKISPQIKLFEADLLKEGSFKEAFTGAKYVIHAASPFFTDVKDGWKELVEPAVNGTKNVFKEALACGVKRIVQTSSMIAICGDQRTKNPDHVFTEADWNEEAIQKGEPTYGYSKVQAEKVAWDFVKEHPELELVVINPSFILGPILSSRAATSVSLIRDLVTGKYKDGAPPRCFGVADIRNVSEAHLKGLSIPETKGHRFVISSTSQHSLFEIAEVVHKYFPGYTGVPTTHLGEPAKPIQKSNDNSKALKVLGITFIPFENTIREMVESLVQYGVVPKP